MAGARSANPNVGDAAAKEVASRVPPSGPLQLSMLFDQLTVECRFAAVPVTRALCVELRGTACLAARCLVCVRAYVCVVSMVQLKVLSALSRSLCAGVAVRPYLPPRSPPPPLPLLFSGQLVHPQWKHFRPRELVKSERTRLSNAIWRSWHMQSEV